MASSPSPTSRSSVTSSAGGASPAGTYTCGFSSAGIGRPYREPLADARTVAVMPQPPAAPRRPHPIVAHGKERVDDWYWLRSDDRSDPEVLDLLAAENDVRGRRAQPTPTSCSRRSSRR